MELTTSGPSTSYYMAKAPLNLLRDKELLGWRKMGDRGLLMLVRAF